MILLGLLLLAATGAFTGLLIADNAGAGNSIPVTVAGNEIAVMSPLGVFLGGIALTVVFFLGLALLLAGRARARDRAVALQAERLRAEQAERRLAAERGSVAPEPAPVSDPSADPDAGPGRAPEWAAAHPGEVDGGVPQHRAGRRRMQLPWTRHRPLHH
ncbi:hypothetical protein ACFYNO_36955 [Kitasatospora sp. NPDC006697]|uniref:hypothetical protein n=1 Tax=Kitasatospora sp. NPDC006697 TaxID=3364020 RepID=UPI003675303C